MKHLMRFNETKKEETQEVRFNAEELIDKDVEPGFITDVEDQEKVEKAFKKEMDKVVKFESFTESRKDSTESVVRNLIRKGETILHIPSTWKDASKEEIEKSSIPAYKDLDFVKSINKCNCCDKCTGESGCYCGCEDCTCDVEDDMNGVEDVISFDDFKNKTEE